MRGVLLVPGFNGTFLIDRAYPKRNIACKTTIRNASTFIDFDLLNKSVGGRQAGGRRQTGGS